MENNSVVKYVFNPPDTLELESGANQPKHDKDSVYFKVKYRYFAFGPVQKRFKSVKVS